MLSSRQYGWEPTASVSMSRSACGTYFGLGLGAVLGGVALWFGIDLLLQPKIGEGSSNFQLMSNSMAPTWFGPHYPVKCTNCETRWNIAAETYRKELYVQCPGCASTECQLGALHSGKMVFVEPARSIERLDCIVFKQEVENSASWNWTCKRVWGLPGEVVSLRRGELWIDGKLFQKSFEQFQRVAIPVDGFQLPKILKDGTIPERRYIPLVREPVLDEYPTNHSTPRNLVQVDDLMLTIVFANDTAQRGGCLVECNYAGFQTSITCWFGDEPSPVSADPKRVHAHDPKQLSVGCWDGSMWAKWDDQPPVQLEQFGILGGELDSTNFQGGLAGHAEFSQGDSEKGTRSSRATKFSIYVIEGSIKIETAHLNRDLYLRDDERDPANGVQAPSLVGAGEFYVLGDNLPISRDSRNGLGNVPSARIVGRMIQ